MSNQQGIPGQLEVFDPRISQTIHSIINLTNPNFSSDTEGHELLRQAYRYLSQVPGIDQPSTQSIKTSVVIENLLRSKGTKGLKDVKTISRRLRRIEKTFDYLPFTPEPYLDFLDTFKADKTKGETGRYKQIMYDYLDMLLEHAVKFGFPKDFLKENDIERPRVGHKPIRVLSLEQLANLCETPEDDREMVVLQLLAGHAWRQIEDTRILARDVRSVEDNTILVHGKEREEFTPILPETLKILQSLTPASLADSEPVLRSQHVMRGVYYPLRSNGIYLLVKRLFDRVGMDFKGHDLRRTFGTWVKRASGNELLAMRLLRDRVQGVNDRYIEYTTQELVVALEKYSPLRLIHNSHANNQVGTAQERVGDVWCRGGDLNSHALSNTTP
jgi:integrase